ncbi:MAG: hypothetical protein ACOY3V_07030 [Pseudomonadota bacterium]
MEITCYRDHELARESLFLPAAAYNLAYALLSRSTTDCLFVPIRAMQYLAILDAEEFVFLDGERKCWVDIAWQNFRPRQRAALTDPVAYEAVYYQVSAAGLMPRLLAEFPRALGELAAKGRFDGPARVLKFPAPARS